ncbi:MAG: helix-turn-helix transcriptional regulator [Agathobacter sp.]|nr:helix-turn-helix transcriptional regulator [Agathobacter sp.]
MYGDLHFNIENIIKEKGISKNQLCKDLNIPRTNLNRYCRDEFQRIDATLVCKLCYYLDVSISELITYEKP